MQVQFVNQAKGIRITKPMPAPKKVCIMAEWLKRARKSVADIPPLHQEPDFWRVHHEEATVGYVHFELWNNKDEKCHVIIDRKASSLGGK